MSASSSLATTGVRPEIERFAGRRIADMRRLARCVSQLVLVAPLVALILSGCATTEPGTVTYPEGHYKMYGDGINTPYYWVWIPNGVSEASVPAPPPIPTRAAVVTAPTVVTTTP